jgi:hypothetical protein
LRDFLPASVLTEDFLVVLEEVLPDTFVEFLLAALEEPLAADFFFGAFLACELLAAVVLSFDGVFFLELVAA